ncbi:MAG TPA: TIGR04255 family protein [Cyanobacteria bacterium UBA11149]|nr:TIGR04255 family protein [Cyanobacteria bacterium UBA11367]HBE57991.1 TIGR04255 family protein [Cyanobacteria bacterium UBA11366]HBK62465.1 TIGR04255 family protein [Cyanobacteria bacterium UBA11166]HBR73998.1 TIGR04255 family protein [Cyanobacteria bacterium UBA11159]HBS72101.1 TIGR04255 family protein [Cyanobacteria bacterium UBA11153]HBW91294.1 TIGR04255 family protein [Cyanobacteria bacterium UBA11149]HCA96246.1 TIGR04255 family protein [Cyanobacteria bacterium UBA9226]
MNWPEFERVIYERNPLIQVTCQLRFPPILKISHQDPVEFQDEIRFQYPLFETTKPQFSSEISQVIQQLGLPLLSDLSYNFKSEDRRWQLSISNDFITLTTFAYERYEQFQKRFREAVEIFERIYKPSFYTRVGLQYQDLIVRSKLGLEDKNWSDLITTDIASELYNQELAPSIQSMIKNLILIAEYGQVNFKHGLVTVKESEKNNPEVAYLLDADFYTEQKVERNENVWNILDQFNKSARKLFRWSITDTLHNAMQPQTVNITNT